MISNNNANNIQWGKDNFLKDFPGGSVIKGLPDTRDMCLIPRPGRSPGVENGKSFNYSCLGNPMDRGAWWATVHGAAKGLQRVGHN